MQFYQEELVKIKNDIKNLIRNTDSVFEIRVIDKVDIDKDHNRILVEITKNPFKELVVTLT